VLAFPDKIPEQDVLHPGEEEIDACGAKRRAGHLYAQDMYSTQALHAHAEKPVLHYLKQRDTIRRAPAG
jgi:hypothetical protein